MSFAAHLGKEMGDERRIKRNGESEGLERMEGRVLGDVSVAKS